MVNGKSEDTPRPRCGVRHESERGATNRATRSLNNKSKRVLLYHELQDLNMPY